MRQKMREIIYYNAWQSGVWDQYKRFLREYNNARGKSKRDLCRKQCE